MKGKQINYMVTVDIGVNKKYVFVGKTPKDVARQLNTLIMPLVSVPDEWEGTIENTSPGGTGSTRTSYHYVTKNVIRNCLYHPHTKSRKYGFFEIRKFDANSLN